jgi:class 3 adenylate cyclase
MEQHVRFCTTSDSARIAYATVGQGYPLIRALGWFTHLEYEWESPLWRHTIEGLARNHLLVRYDGRGTGLSDRSVTEHSVESWVKDLEAVVDALELDRFALLGISQGGSTAISYTVRHPERVSHLVLYGSFAHWPFPLENPEQRQVFESLLTLVRAGWGRNVPSFRQIFTSLFVPGGSAEQMRMFDDLQRRSCSPENAVALFRAFSQTDVTDLLPKVATPTLVVHRREDKAVPFRAGRELASAIAGARLVTLEGQNHIPLEGEEASKALIAAIEEFVGTAMPAQAFAATAPASAPLTILFTDMEGSTTLTQRLGDARAQELLRTHNRVIRDALLAHGGSETKHTGDGIMASFLSASRALQCAIAIQQALASENERLLRQAQDAWDTQTEPVEARPVEVRVRIGLNAGEPIAEESDLFGTAVQVAARVCAKAEPGQILASDVVRQLAAGKGFLFSDRGEVALRGFEDPVRLYEVRW